MEITPEMEVGRGFSPALSINGGPSGSQPEGRHIVDGAESSICVKDGEQRESLSRSNSFQRFSSLIDRARLHEFIEVA